MERKYPHLFSPLKIGNVTLKNRIESAPTSYPELTADGLFTKDCIGYYKMKAKGGAAVVTIGETCVHGATGKAHPKHIVFDIINFRPVIFSTLCEAADAIRDHGAVPSIELSHNGAYVDKQFIGGRNPVSSSAFVKKPEFPGQVGDTQVEEMSESLIHEIGGAFGNAAGTAKAAGFGMVTIHAGHGWLISQFLSPFLNFRNDKWGGSTENRARFLCLILDNVRAKCGKELPIEVRISGSEVSDRGYGIEEGIKIAKLIAPKINLLHVSAGNMLKKETPSLSTFPSAFLPHAPNAKFAAAIKPHVNIPVVAVGGIYKVDEMEKIIASGQADMVAMARQLIADPYLPKKANLGRDDEIRPCLRCYVCQDGIRETNLMKCAVNPVIGREYETWFTPPVKERKKVLIAGGGVAGIQAAITAAERGHEVTLCEKSGALGGVIKRSDYADFKEQLQNYVQYMIRTVNSSNVKVKLYTEVTRELVGAEMPDVLIAALGAAQLIPDIKGVDNKKVISGIECHNEGVRIGSRVVVIGGGMVGCEAAICFNNEGRDVTVIEMLPQMANDVNNSYRQALLLELSKGVKQECGQRCTEITNNGVKAVDLAGMERFYGADTVILATGARPPTEKVDALRNTAPEFYVIGDCASPGKILGAVRSGYNTAMDI
jgi:2,4-dienoyl-CoA reductase-like NADH-dependent reductase (Old Yellow Enzyme family)/thioredoxin reductase